MHQQILQNKQSLQPNIETFSLNNYLNHEQLNRKTICLPLEFQYIPVQILSKQFTKLNNPHPYRIHYLGPRYKNTLQMHKKNSHSGKKPFVYHSPLFGNYNDIKYQKLLKSKQLFLNFNKQGLSSQQEQKYKNFQEKVNIQKSVSQNVYIAQNLVERYKIDMHKIVHSYLLEQKLKNTQFFKNTVYYRAFQGMNPSLSLQNEIIFNSCFQGGNLDCVIKIDERQYDLFLRIDSNTRGHLLWFYFSVKNQNKLGKIKMNICNFSKSKTLYKQGLRPYVFSSCKHKQQGKGWQQSGVNLGLQKRQLNYQVLQNKVKNNNINCLIIQYDFQLQNDQVFFSYCIPYTYSQLLNDIEKLPSKYVEKSYLGKSLLGTNIPILHITDQLNTHSFNSKIPQDKAQTTTTNFPSDNEKNQTFDKQQRKKIIFATGRIHPSQSNSSYVIMGFIQWLCSEDKQAVELRKIARFVIVPMVNPDGVIIGNSRTSASGKDLNRQYINPDPLLHPEICLIKQFAKKVHKDQQIALFLDFHGHSRKKNTFFYGPVYNISQPNYYKCRILPKLIEKISNPFRFHSCSFNLIDEKKKTARASMFQSLGIEYTYTVESSIGYFYDCEQLKIFEFSQQSWCKMGSAIAKGTGYFILGIDEYEQILNQKRKQRLKKKRFYKNLQTKVQYLQDQMLISIQTGQEPLKIIYEDKDRSLSPKSQPRIKNRHIFMDLLQQIKTSIPKKSQSPDKLIPLGRQINKNKSQIDPKQLDIEEDSDSHDQNEDMQLKRLKQFSYLVKQQLKSQLINKQQHNYEIIFTGQNEKSKKGNIQHIKNNKLINEFQIMNQTQKNKKIKSRNIKTGDGLRNKIKQIQFQSNSSIKQKTLPQELNQNNQQILKNFHNMGKYSQKKAIYTSNKNKRDKKIQDKTQKRQKTIGNYFGQYRLLITDDSLESQKKIQKYDSIIKRLQNKRDISKKKRAQSSNQIKTNYIEYNGSFPMNINPTTLINRLQKPNQSDVIHGPTQFTFALPFTQMVQSSKSYILKPKLKIHIKQKPHSVQNFHNSLTTKQRQSSTNVQQKSQKIIRGYFQSQKDSVRQKKVSQSYLVHHGVGHFLNRASHFSQKGASRQGSLVSKINLGEINNTSLINTLKFFQI